MTIFPEPVARECRATLDSSAARGFGNPRSLRWRRVKGRSVGGGGGGGGDGGAEGVAIGGEEASDEVVLSAEEPGAESPGVESKSRSCPASSTSISASAFLLGSERR